LTDARPAEEGRRHGEVYEEYRKIAKALEEKMVRKAKDPKTKAKVSKRFKKWKAKH
jgi:hypothetical protein